MRPTMIAVLVLLSSVSSFAQSIAVDMNPFGGRVTVTPPPGTVTTTTTRVEEVTGDGFHITYRPSESGYTQLEIVEPQGAHATLWDGTFLLGEDDVPTSVTVQSGKWLRVVVTRPDGAVFERKIQTRAGLVGTVRVYGFAAPAPAVVVVAAPLPAPNAIGAADFRRLKSAIEAESFSDQKLDVLRTAAEDAWFTCEQVGQLVELFSFGNDKVAAVGVVRDRIIDRQNAFTLYERFTFSNDKDAVKRLLSAR